VQLATHASTRLVVLVWVGMGVVLSNAYKGQNITDLTAPLPPIPIKYFKELLELNFTIISRPKSMLSEDEFYVAAYLYNEYEIKGNMSVTLKKLRSEWLNLTVMEETVLEIVAQKIRNSKLDYMSKLLPNIQKLVYNQLWNDIMKSNLNEGFLKYVTNCNRSAYVGYSDEIEESVSILKGLVYHSNIPEKRKIAVESVTTGKEILAKSHKTWKVHLVAAPGDYVFKRITGLLESGITKQWYAFEKRVKSYADLLLLSNIKAEPKKTAAE